MVKIIPRKYLSLWLFIVCSCFVVHFALINLVNKNLNKRDTFSGDVLEYSCRSRHSDKTIIEYDAKQFSHPALTFWAGIEIGIANHMFAYAALYAISKRNNRTAFMTPAMSDRLSEYFKISMPRMSRSVCEWVPWEERILPRNPEVFTKLTTDVRASHVMYRGNQYPNFWKYFQDLLPDIRQEFQFLDHISSAAEAKINEAVVQGFGDEATVTVGVHVRRGDFINYSKNANIEPPTLEFYVGAMEYFQNKYKNVIFIVASDDIEWCMDNFLPFTKIFKISFLNGSTVREKGGLDLVVLAKCDHVIFGLSTFGFWSAYLSSGEKVFCADCVSPNMTVDGSFYRLWELCSFTLKWKGFSRTGEELITLLV